MFTSKKDFTTKKDSRYSEQSAIEEAINNANRRFFSLPQGEGGSTSTVIRRSITPIGDKPSTSTTNEISSRLNAGSSGISKAPHLKLVSVSESYTRDTLKKFGFIIGDSLGEGSYAKVRRADYTVALNNEKYQYQLACKVINRTKAPSDFLDKFLPRELEIVRKLDHENVIKIHSVIELGSKIFIFMELAEGGDLLDFIRRNGALENDNARKWFGEFVAAIKYIHSQDIVHRDLKCENLLLDKNRRIKITDFGFSRYATDAASGKRILSRTYCGSAAYAAPEILQGNPYNPKMYDIWSMGIILYIMVTGSMPYDDSNIRKMLKAQLEKPLTYPSRVRNRITSECKALITHILQVDVTRRATVAQISTHQWLKSSPTDENQQIYLTAPGAVRRQTGS